MVNAAELLEALLSAIPALTREAPRDSRGLYGLIDHEGRLRYIGSTSSPTQTLYERIHCRHRTGSEAHSHYFSRMYNTGRMWRDPSDATTRADGAVAKALRNAFIADHCRAVWVILPDHLDIARLEAEVLAIAPAHAIAWNRRAMPAYDEPVALVDQTLSRLGLSAGEVAATERQSVRYGLRFPGSAVVPDATPVRPGGPALPTGPFRFFAIDVETANNDPSSICQMGLACVGQDGRIETWSTLIDPGATDWTCSFVHGLFSNDVRGAPRFDEIFDQIHRLVKGSTVYQHSGFDRRAIEAACRARGLDSPSWDWRDSLLIARRAWPHLKGNGGHGLASLKAHLGIAFRHHDAGEDARAAAEIVLRAEREQGIAQNDLGGSQEGRPAAPAVVSETPTNPSPLVPTEPNPAGRDRELAGMVPIAADGTCFHPGLARRGAFTIGPKGAERRITSFDDALRALRNMAAPRWRRPNGAGNWGIVSGIDWRPLTQQSRPPVASVIRTGSPRR